MSIETLTNAERNAKASAQVKASAEMECTEPELTIDADAKLTVDKAKAEATIKALKNGLPKLLSIKARLKPIEMAVKTTAQTGAELAEMGPKFINSFKDQALCISGQVAAAAGEVMIPICLGNSGSGFLRAASNRPSASSFARSRS